MKINIPHYIDSVFLVMAVVFELILFRLIHSTILILLIWQFLWPYAVWVADIVAAPWPFRQNYRAHRQAIHDAAPNRIRADRDRPTMNCACLANRVISFDSSSNRNRLNRKQNPTTMVLCLMIFYQIQYNCLMMANFCYDLCYDLCD